MDNGYTKSKTHALHECSPKLRSSNTCTREQQDLDKEAGEEGKKRGMNMKRSIAGTKKSAKHNCPKSLNHVQSRQSLTTVRIRSDVAPSLAFAMALGLASSSFFYPSSHLSCTCRFSPSKRSKQSVIIFFFFAVLKEYGSSSSSRHSWKFLKNQSSKKIIRTMAIKNQYLK